MRPFIEGIKNENCLLVQEWLQVPAVHGSSSGLQPVEPAELWPLLLSASPSPNAPPPPLLASSPALTPELCESVPLALQNRQTHVWKNLMKKLMSHTSMSHLDWLKLIRHCDMRGWSFTDVMTVPFCALCVCSSICLSLCISSSFSRSIRSFSFSACSRLFFSFSSCALLSRKQ